MNVRFLGRDEGQHIVMIDGIRHTMTDAQLLEARIEPPEETPDWKAMPATSIDMVAAAQIADANGYVTLRKEEHDALLRTQPSDDDLKKYAESKGVLLIPKSEYDDALASVKHSIEDANEAKTIAEGNVVAEKQRAEKLLADLTAAQSRIEELEALPPTPVTLESAEAFAAEHGLTIIDSTDLDNLLARSASEAPAEATADAKPADPKAAKAK